jgi:hypothetical protein
MIARFARMCFVATVLSGSFANPGWSQNEATQVLVTPRFWYAFLSSTDRLPFAVSVIHTAIPMYGGTIAVIPKGMGGTTFSLTALYGNGSGDYQEGEGGGGFLFRGNNDFARLDIEALAQIPIGRSGAYWSAGVRYVRTDSDSFGVAGGLQGGPIAPSPFRFIGHGNFYLGELGFGGSTQLDAKGTHRFFGGLTFVAGQRQEDFSNICCAPLETEKGSLSRAVGGIDTNFGYAFNLSSQATFYARYRVFALSELDRFASPDTLSVVHGPEFNLTFKLN